STIFSPSGALLPQVVRSASLSLTKCAGNTGPAASSGLGATRTSDCAGARSRVLFVSGEGYGGGKSVGRVWAISFSLRGFERPPAGRVYSFSRRERRRYGSESAAIVSAVGPQV